mmetsp:Transcript_23386/g.61202  ORF Transcript_23386/g.61202 Transcript_23386/m.61202 type:complete len:223 (+) Transcript_23386:215-883(+)
MPAVIPSIRAREKEAIIPVFPFSFSQASSREYPPERATTRTTLGCSMHGVYRLSSVGMLSLSITSCDSSSLPSSTSMASNKSFSASALSSMLMSTSGSMMGQRPHARIRLATSNCCDTTAATPSALAAAIRDRILVPKTPSFRARPSVSSSPGMSFITWQPFSSGARPLSHLSSGTTCFFSHRYCGAGIPSNSRSIVISNRMAASTRSPENLSHVTMRARMA